GHPGFIFVDRDARRFRNEKSIESHAGLLAVDFYDTAELKYPRIPCYAIFDEDARTKGPITALAGEGYAGKRYTWSVDNSAEIQKEWIKKGATLAELAGQLKIDAATLEATLAKWNEDIKQGEDTLFHRPIKAPATEGIAYQDRSRPVWAAPIEKAPFYALELYPTLLNTQGGPRRNIKGQILDAFDQPIPRLYSAGEIGSMWGVIYQGAGNNAESIVFGQIAGKNAAAEAPFT
ncbi:FAD-binding protein, partial [Telmatospirillum sp.]|uniref:FAD-binding protein n=1 Tax=Telmatospirillum sp. TaxID=2079197 RepID=UPI00283B540D